MKNLVALCFLLAASCGPGGHKKPEPTCESCKCQACECDLDGNCECPKCACKHKYPESKPSGRGGDGHDNGGDGGCSGGSCGG